MNDEWLVGENGYGKWITLKVSIKDYEITKATVIVEGNNPITVTGDKTKVGAGRLFIMQGYIDAEISSIKVVNGMDYTSYSGEYATKFYYNGETANTTESTDTSAQTSDSYIPMLIVGFLVSSVIAVALTVKRRIFVR